MLESIRTQQYNAGQIITGGWQQFRRNWLNIISIFLLINLPLGIVLCIMGINGLAKPGNWYYMSFIWAQILFNPIATIASAYIIESSVNGEQISFEKALQHALCRWPAAIWTTILGTLIIMAFSLLMFIPGLIIGIYYSFFIYVVALRGMSGMKALCSSKQLIKGHWWRTFLITGIVGIMNFIATILLSSPYIIFKPSPFIDSMTNTIANVFCGAIFTSMLIVLFLNTDYLTNTPKTAEESDDNLTPMPESNHS